MATPAVTKRDVAPPTIQKEPKAVPATLKKELAPTPSTDTKRDSEISYDPYEHRSAEPAELESNLQAFMNLLKGVLGTGILALPFAFKYSGYIEGIIALLVLGLLSAHSTILMFKSQYIVCKRKEISFLSYPDTFGYSFEYGPKWLRCLSKHGSCVCLTFITVYQTGLICIYYLFLIENLKLVVKMWHPNEWSTVAYGAMILIPVLAIMCVRDLRRLATLSLVANLCIFTAVIIIVVAMAKDGLPDIGDRKKFTPIDKFPLFISTVSFAYCAIGVVVAVQSNMQHPSNFVKWNGVWVWSISITAFMYCSFGCLGYLKYGDDAKGVVILNLPQDWMGATARILVILAIYETFALNAFYPFSVFFYDLWLPHLDPSRSHLLPEFTVRFGLVFFSYLMAILIPHIHLLISLMGSVCLPPLLFIFPSMMDYVLHYNRNLGCAWHRIWLNFIIVAFSIAVLVMGTYLSIVDIVEALKKTDYTK